MGPPRARGGSSMLSIIFLVYAVVHIALWIWGWRLWARHGRPVALFVLLFANTLLFYDNLRIGLGRFIGEGELLRAMTVPAFAWHWTFLPLLVIAAGSVARLAGLAWARNKAVMGAFCVVAVLLAALDIPMIFTLELYPACLADTLRYTTTVTADVLCRPDDPLVQGENTPFVAIVTNLVVLAVGIALWIQRSWPWLAAGSGAMFVAAGAFGASHWSLPIANFGEVLITAGFLWTCVHFARLRNEPARATGSGPIPREERPPAVR